jgi:hypothetical protein
LIFHSQSCQCLILRVRFWNTIIPLSCQHAMLLLTNPHPRGGW